MIDLCPRCNDSGWVCELHDDQPWERPDGAGHCGEPGVPCPDCNPCGSRDDPPDDSRIMPGPLTPHGDAMATFDVDRDEWKRISGHMRVRPGKPTTIKGESGLWNIKKMTTDFVPGEQVKTTVVADRNIGED